MFVTVFVFFGIIILDQILKIVVRFNMTPGETIPIVENVFHLTYVLNPGAAFGILENQRLFFVAAGVLVFAAVAFFYKKLTAECLPVRYGTVALLGGAMGNLIDRMYNGLVVDFFDFRVWPVFNVADIAIVCGTLFMLYGIFFRPEPEIHRGHKDVALSPRQK